jgi:hypothetical protein
MAALTSISDRNRIELALQRGLLEGIRPQSIIPMAQDASTRKYYRVTFDQRIPAVLMLQPNPGAGEERAFLETQTFLYGLDLPVPRVYAHDHRLGIVALEDLGDMTLESLALEWEEGPLNTLYEEAILILVEMRKRTHGMNQGCPAFGLAFDFEKLMWEMEFFVDHFLIGFSGLSMTKLEKKTLFDLFTRVCSVLAEQPRVFTHRDYHCRNLMFHEEQLVMIDFQDARMGPAQYDLASLLSDSYMTLGNETIDRLLSLYCKESLPQGLDDYGDFLRVYELMRLQRNIKALGTFGFQISCRKNERYRSSILRTARHIEENITRNEELLHFRPIVLDLIVGPARSA